MSFAAASLSGAQGIAVRPVNRPVLVAAGLAVVAGSLLLADDVSVRQSLLFLVGAVGGAGNLDLLAVNFALIAAAIIGDTFGYMLGRQTGPRIFKRPDSRLFHREHLERTQAFYEKHGGKTIIYARFVPVLRTFAPFVAGVGKMNYTRFLSFDIFGGIGWVLTMTTLGYMLGGVPVVKQHLEKVILLILLISAAPVVIEGVKAYRKSA